MDISNVKHGLGFIFQGVNHLLWPAVCINCGESIGADDGGLCADCWGRVLSCTGGDYCGRCGRDASRYALVEGRCPDCLDKEIYFDGIARSGLYDHALREMILALKFAGRTELDRLLGFLCNSALEGANFCKEVELIVPVPLHWSRRLSRGYNQAKVLAGRLKHPFAKPNKDLVRVRNTRPQLSTASSAARAANVAGAFAVRRGSKFQGRKICLVDDIKTSGATLNECAKTLKEAGASKVFSLVLAVAGQDTK